VSGIPVLVEAQALRVLVAGGGRVAARKLRLLVEAGASVRVVAPSASAEVRDLAAAGRMELLERGYAPEDIGDAQLVIAATNDRAVNAAVARDAHAAHRLVDVTDAPAEGSFAMMAVHRSGALVVGVSAGGVPGAAARVRDAIAQRFDARYGRAIGSLAALRRSLLDRGRADDWRTLAGQVVDAEFCASVERESVEERVASWR
jgi:siroheme synthase-like protein